MKKKNVEDASALRIKTLRTELRLVIEKYFVDHKLSTREVMTLLPMALYDIFERIAKSEEISSDEVFGTFVKLVGAWDYLKRNEEG